VTKYQIVKTIDIGDNGRVVTLDEKRMEGNWIFDRLKNQKYAVLDQTIDFIVNRPIPMGIYRAYIISSEAATTLKLSKKSEAKGEVSEGEDLPAEVTDASLAGATASLTPLGSVYAFKPNAGLIADIVDSGHISKVFKTKQEMGILLLVFIIGILVGTIFLAPLMGTLIVGGAK
jgi:hypothetical protein